MVSFQSCLGVYFGDSHGPMSSVGNAPPDRNVSFLETSDVSGRKALVFLGLHDFLMLPLESILIYGVESVEGTHGMLIVIEH